MLHSGAGDSVSHSPLRPPGLERLELAKTRASASFVLENLEFREDETLAQGHTAGW